MSEDKKIQYIIEAIDETGDGLDSAKKGFNSAAAGSDKFAESTDKANSKAAMLTKTSVAMGAAIVATGAMIVKAVASSIALADSIDRASKMMQLSTKEYQKWDYVMRLAGGSAQDLTAAMQRVQNAAFDASNGSKEATATFKSLGVSIKDSSGNIKSSNVLFEETVSALTKVENTTQRAALAQNVFGIGAKTLLPLLSQSADEIKKQREEAERLGQVLSEKAVKGLDDLGDSFDVASKAAKNATAEIVTSLSPALIKMANYARDAAVAMRKVFAPNEQDKANKEINALKQEIDSREQLLNRTVFMSKKRREEEEQAIELLKRQYNLRLDLSKIQSEDRGSATAPKGSATQTAIPTSGGSKQSFDDYAASIGMPSKLNIQYATEQYEKLNELNEKNRELIRAAAEKWDADQIQKAADLAAAKIEIDQKYADKKKALEEETAKRAKETAEKERQMKLTNFQMVAGGFNDLMGAIGQATKESASAQKAIAIVQAVINTAVGITRCYAEQGIAGYVTGALVAAAGAVQIATIASQNFALGGVARRTPGAVSDSVPINVNPDERIVTKRQENNLTRFLNNPDNQGRGDTFNIYDYSGDLVETFVSKVRNGQGDSFKSLLQSRFVMA